MDINGDPFQDVGDLGGPPQYPKVAQLSGGVSRKTKSFSDFMEDVKSSKSTKKGKKVLDKVVDAREAARLKRKAMSALGEQFSVYELARILQDPSYSLESYMKFLREIREDPTHAAKARMDAADKIMKTIIGIMKAAGAELDDFTRDPVSDHDRRVLGAVSVAQQKILPDNGDNNEDRKGS